MHHKVDHGFVGKLVDVSSVGGLGVDQAHAAADAFVVHNMVFEKFVVQLIWWHNLSI